MFKEAHIRICLTKTERTGRTSLQFLTMIAKESDCCQFMLMMMGPGKNFGRELEGVEAPLHHERGNQRQRWGQDQKTRKLRANKGRYSITKLAR